MARGEPALEDVALDPSFWHGRRVLVTGHTGFKGAWLCVWLEALGAEVAGYANAIRTTPSLYELARVEDGLRSCTGDVRDGESLRAAFDAHRPEVVILMAAQSLVRASFRDPVTTYETNVLGTVRVLEAARQSPDVRAIVNVTSDKAYENREWEWGYREDDAKGGHDPYSSSKGCAELVGAAYRRSFFAGPDAPALASARAGNVIGGGDFGEDRLIPDLMRAVSESRPAAIRNPGAVRPWQHVLNPLSGYLLLAQRLWERTAGLGDGLNFGPTDGDARPVGAVVERITELWGEDLGWATDPGPHPHEAHYLKLDSSRARMRLGWRPRWGLEEGLERTVEWYRAHHRGEDVSALTRAQVEAFSAVPRPAG